MATAQDSICKSSQLSSKMAEAREGRHLAGQLCSAPESSLGSEAAGRRFFFSSLADHALRLGPISKQTNQKCKTLWSAEICKSSKSMNRRPKPRRPANPPARFAFRQQEDKQNTNKQKPEPKQNTHTLEKTA
jgi:hypothetical protein